MCVEGKTKSECDNVKKWWWQKSMARMNYRTANALYNDREDEVEVVVLILTRENHVLVLIGRVTMDGSSYLLLVQQQNGYCGRQVGRQNFDMHTRQKKNAVNSRYDDRRYIKVALENENFRKRNLVDEDRIECRTLFLLLLTKTTSCDTKYENDDVARRDNTEKPTKLI